MKTMNISSKLAAIATAITTLGLPQSEASIVTTTTYNNKTYYVDVLPVGSTADVWFRTAKYACSPGDIHVAVISRKSQKILSKQTIQQAASTLCSVKEVWDTGKTVVGCAATAGTAICLTASVPTGGATAVVCTVALKYTLTTGAKDCFFGVSNKVATWLAGERNWSAYAAGFNVAAGSWSGAIDHAIDWACTYNK